jgi:hypothetical protein
MGEGARTPPAGRRLAIGVVVAALVVVGGILVLVGPWGPTGDGPVDGSGQVEAATDELAWPLTGMPTDVLPQRPALLVKVSNSPEARPQTGLAHADLVFEEVVEGGATRFIAVLHSRIPEVIGPVRSARPVDVGLLSGFGQPGFAYSGARPEVRQMLAGAPAVPLTEGGPGFFRDGGAYASHAVAPHNLFLRPGDAVEAVVERGARPLGDDVGWVFDDRPPAPSTGGDPEGGRSVRIPMSASSVTTWVYDDGAGRYHRQQDGTPMEVTGSERVAAANVVVLDVRHYVGASGYPETEVLGSGPGLALRDGQLHRLTWSKPTPTDPLLLRAAGQATPFPLRPGPTWIHLADALPTGSGEAPA